MQQQFLAQDDINERDSYRAELRVENDKVTGIVTKDGEPRGSISFSEHTEPRRVVAVKCRTWNTFRRWIDEVASNDYNPLVAFRGHGDSRYTLCSSLARMGRTRIERYVYQDMAEFKRAAEVVLNRRIDPKSGDDTAMLFGLAQHHGLPTPLIDWTESPYIAAFFAFTDALENRTIKGRRSVRVLGLSQRFALRAPPVLFIANVLPYYSYFNVGALSNPRLLAQQGRFVATNIADLENYILRHTENREQELFAVDIPVSQGDTALADLRRMGLTSASLFPDLDGLCRRMKQEMLLRSRMTEAQLGAWTRMFPSPLSNHRIRTIDDDL